MLASLRSPAVKKLSPPARGIAYLVEQGLGTACAPDALAALSADDRAALAKQGIAAGELTAFVRALVRPEALAVRRALARAFYGRVPAPPPRGATSVPVEHGVDAGAYLATGWIVLGGGAVRADVAERLAAFVRDGSIEPRRAASTLGCKVSSALAVIDAIAALLPPSASAVDPRRDDVDERDASIADEV